jgi:hypothetical protein
MKEALPDLDFTDSSLISFELINDELTIHMCLWNEKEIRIKFLNLMKFKYEISDFICGIYESDDHEILKKEIKNPCNMLDESCRFKLYKIMDIYDFSSSEIIAECLIVL